MREIFSLGARLLQCADMVPEGTRLVDIGTDHGYLPIWLLKQNKISSAIAADINDKPLMSAKSNALKYNVEITTILSAGFNEIKQDDFDTAVIAGMGGELIVSIIDEARYLSDCNKTLVLQPMSNPHKLREYLLTNSYDIVEEKAVFDKGKVYSVMLVTCKKAEQDFCMYMGKIVPKSDNSKLYAEKTIRSLKNKIHGACGEEKVMLEEKVNEIERKYL